MPLSARTLEGAIETMQMQIALQNASEEPSASETRMYTEGGIKFTWRPLHEQRFHIYARPHNPGALELTQELSQLLQPLGLKLEVTTDVSNLASCRHMLLYLDARTWTGDDDRRDKLKREVLKAMSIRSVPLLLAHEDGPFEYQPATAERHGILFDELIHGVDGGTPIELLQRQAPRPPHQRAVRTLSGSLTWVPPLD